MSDNIRSYDPVDAYRAHAGQLSAAIRGMLEDLVSIRTKKMSKEELRSKLLASDEQIDDFECYDADPSLQMVRLYALAIGANVEIKVSDRDAGTEGSKHYSLGGHHVSSQPIATKFVWSDIRPESVR